MTAGRQAAPLSGPWLVIFVLLGAAPVLRIGDLQLVELLQLLWLGLATPFFVYQGLKIPSSGIWRRYGSGYLMFLGLCAGLSILSLRLTFYPPPDISILKQPVFLSLSRIFELFLVAYFMIAIAGALRRRPALLRLALDTYSWAGVASACVSIASWVLVTVAGISTFPVYGTDSRARGFFNEGGPYGMFLVSVALVILLRSRLFRPAYPVLRKLALSLLLIALVLSGSKAGFLAVILLCAIGLLVSGSRGQRLALLAGCAVVVFAFLSLFEGKVIGYFYAYLNFDEAMAYRPDDPSLIMGRVTGALIVPRMVAAHPVLGIGVGNYSLMRNDPDYLEGLPPVDSWDLAGMGLAGSTAEFGIPLTLLLLALLLRPLMHARKRRAPAIITVAAGFQPLALLLGVNLNFFYPWLVASFVLALEPCQPS
jgi:hypothetical protein